MLRQQERELDYHRFCSYCVHDILGSCIEGEYLYIIQNTKISVYEYHGKSDIPQLSEELIHNTAIQHYSINRHYICIGSPSLIEVRDRKHWENVIHVHNVNLEEEQVVYIELDQHFLYVASKTRGVVTIQKIDIESKQNIDTFNLGKVSQCSLAIMKTIHPMLLSSLGIIIDFYIWVKSQSKVELGMLFAQGGSMATFPINEIEIEDGVIMQAYQHRVKCVKYPNQSIDYVALIVEKADRQLYLCLYEIGSKSRPKEQGEGKDKQQLNAVISHFIGLANINAPKPNSLVQEVLNEAIADERKGKKHFQVKLEGLASYRSSYRLNDRIWVQSCDKIIEIELISQQSIENLVKNVKSAEALIKSMVFHNKPKHKTFVGIYKDRLLFSQATTSFDITFHRHEQIAEEIQQYEVNDQILENQDKEAKLRLIEEAKQQIEDILELNLGEAKEENQCHDVEVADHCSQTEADAPLRQSKEVGTQTIPQGIIVEERVVEKQVGLQAIKDQVAKFSSQVSASCIKVKQNSYIKDKFDREIYSIVEGIVKDSVHPHLQSKFIAQLDQRIKDITQHISTVFQAQLEALNQFVRKHETKESNLRGRRIFEFSTQINDIKETVSIITDALKANQLHKHAFSQVLIEEAKEIKQQVASISSSILDIDKRNQAFQKEINDEISEIFQLIKGLQERQRENMQEDSECEGEESECEGEQREEETSEQQVISEDSNREPQEMHYPNPYASYALRVQQEGKRKKEPKGYTPYPPYPAPTQMPYYYPFMPQVPSLPMQPYYPNYPYPLPRSSKKKGKASRKANRKLDE